MKLYLDSTNNLKTIIRLDTQEFTKEYSSPRDQDIFAFLQEVLKRQNLETSAITEIEVNAGPGSFTGCRLGVAVANALAFTLGLPVNGQTPPILPIYPENITWKAATSN